MHETHSDNLRQYLTDMIGLESDISKAIRGQLEDERVGDRDQLASLLELIAHQSEGRLATLKRMAENEGGGVGLVLKEGVMTAAGVLAGIYGKMREHPVSRSVLDDVIAQTTAATSYGMLLTLALTAGHSECAAVAVQGLKECAPTVTLLTRELPQIVAEELAEDAPSANPAASHVALDAIRDAWAGAPST